MSIYSSRDKPGEANSIPKIEKPGNKPGSRSENIEAQYNRLPKHKPAAQLLALLREQHTVFRDCLPLAIGIHRAIGAAYPEFGKTAIRRALQFHAHSLAYLKNLAAGGHRYDLAGQPWGLITPEHQHYAQEQLTLKEQRDAKRGAPKQTQRPVPSQHLAAQRSRTLPPWKTGDGADRDAVALRLKGTRPRLTLKRKEEHPRMVSTWRR